MSDHRIIRAIPRVDHTVHIEWGDGSKSVVDLSSYKTPDGIFKEWSDPVIFTECMHIHWRGISLAWEVFGRVLDFHADSLWRDARHLSASAAGPPLEDRCARLGRQFFLRDGVDPDAPGLYVWKIGGIIAYVGKYTRRHRPERHYRRNLERYFSGRSYRRLNPAKFRAIHLALARALEDDSKIELWFWENAPVDELNQRERQRIRELFPVHNGT